MPIIILAMKLSLSEIVDHLDFQFFFFFFSKFFNFYFLTRTIYISRTRTHSKTITTGPQNNLITLAYIHMHSQVKHSISNFKTCYLVKNFLSNY